MAPRASAKRPEVQAASFIGTCEESVVRLMGSPPTPCAEPVRISDHPLKSSPNPDETSTKHVPDCSKGSVMQMEVPRFAGI